MTPEQKQTIDEFFEIADKLAAENKWTQQFQSYMTELAIYSIDEMKSCIEEMKKAL